jgi:glycerophosphoryl diester phosphodiesterase
VDRDQLPAPGPQRSVAKDSLTMDYRHSLNTLALLFSCVFISGAVEIVAHRGASHDAPENTLAAMKLAWEQKTDAIELDLWLSKDGRIVILHDANTKRFGGNTNHVAQQSWAELQRVDVGAWKDPRFKGERIPTLASILATIPAGKRAVLEIKCGPEILPELGRVIAKSGRKPSELAIIAFDYETLRQSKKEFPQLEHYFLHDYKKDKQTGELPILPALIQRAKAAGFDGLDLHFNWPIDKAFVGEVKGAGLKLIAWTVNDVEVARRLSEAGVDGITTDRPAWLREALAHGATTAR